MGNPVIFNGAFVKTLKDQIKIKDTARILTGSADPSSVATTGERGSIYLRNTGAAGVMYIKQDNGSSTNWSLLTTTTTNELIPTTVAGTSATIAAGNRYFLQNAALTTLTLPATMTLGARFGVVSTDTNTAGFKIVTGAATQQFFSGSSFSGVGTLGEIASSIYGSCFEVECVDADDKFQISNFNGDFTLYLFQGRLFSYFTGGNTGAASDVIDKLTYVGEGITTIGAVIPVAKYRHSNGKSALKGYGLAGRNTAGSIIDTIFAFTFVGESAAAIGAVTSTVRNVSGSGSTAIKCFAAGGYTDAGYTTTTSGIDTLTFSTEAIATLSDTLSSSRGIVDSSTVSPSKSFFWGGQSGSGFTGGTTATIDALIHSDESCGAMNITLSTAKTSAAGFGSTTNGFYAGGSTTGAGATSVSTIEKLAYIVELRTTLLSTLGAATYETSGTPSTMKGFLGGGLNSAGSNVSTIDSLIFNSELRQSVTATISSARFGISSVQI